MYGQISNISRTAVGNKLADHSYVVGPSPAGTAPTTSSYSPWHLGSMGIGQRQLEDEARNIYSFGLGKAYTRGLTVDVRDVAWAIFNHYVMLKLRDMCTWLDDFKLLSYQIIATASQWFFGLVLWFTCGRGCSTLENSRQCWVAMLIGTKPLPEPMLTYHDITHLFIVIAMIMILSTGTAGCI